MERPKEVTHEEILKEVRRVDGDLRQAKNRVWWASGLIGLACMSGAFGVYARTETHEDRISRLEQIVIQTPLTNERVARIEASIDAIREQQRRNTDALADLTRFLRQGWGDAGAHDR